MFSIPVCNVRVPSWKLCGCEGEPSKRSLAPGNGVQMSVRLVKAINLASSSDEHRFSCLPRTCCWDGHGFELGPFGSQILRSQAQSRLFTPLFSLLPLHLLHQPRLFSTFAQSYFYSTRATSNTPPLEPAPSSLRTPRLSTTTSLSVSLPTPLATPHPRGLSESYFYAATCCQYQLSRPARTILESPSMFLSLDFARLRSKTCRCLGNASTVWNVVGWVDLFVWTTLSDREVRLKRREAVGKAATLLRSLSVQVFACALVALQLGSAGGLERNDEHQNNPPRHQLL